MKKATRELTLAAFIWYGQYDASYPILLLVLYKT